MSEFRLILQFWEATTAERMKIDLQHNVSDGIVAH